jgi:chemotaxis protein MotB
MAEENKKSHCEPCDEEVAPLWMCTFCDLMSLLLCFFVLFYSLSETNASKASKGEGSLQGAFGIMSKNPAVISKPNVTLPTLKNIQRAIVARALSNMQDLIKAEKLGDDAKVVIMDKGVALTISSPLLFESGSAELKSQAFPLLDKVFMICQGWPNIIRVEGHTDNTPVAEQSTAFESNWDLAFARALSVVNFAVQFSKIHPSRLVPVSFGEYQPLADNSTEEGRAKNRRIEILMEYKKDEPDPFK